MKCIIRLSVFLCSYRVICVLYSTNSSRGSQVSATGNNTDNNNTSGFRHGTADDSDSAAKLSGAS